MDNTVILTGLGVVISVVTLLYMILRNFRTDMAERFGKIESEFKEVRSEIREIRSEIKEIRTGVNRLEGAFMAKDCCFLGESNQKKKAE